MHKSENHGTEPYSIEEERAQDKAHVKKCDSASCNRRKTPHLKMRVGNNEYDCCLECQSDLVEAFQQGRSIREEVLRQRQVEGRVRNPISDLIKENRHKR